MSVAAVLVSHQNGANFQTIEAFAVTAGSYADGG
jgi:hypothetical protein